MITEKELVNDIVNLKDRIWLHSHPMLKGITNTKTWNEVYNKIEDIISFLRSNGIK
jgi:hypothetical protein